MKAPCLIAAAGALLSGVDALVPSTEAQALNALALLARALPANAPHGYTPQHTSCPSSAPTIRSGSSLSHQESEWLIKRRNATLEPMRDLLSRMGITGLDTDAYINNNKNNASVIPNIGIAVSGGGYRAMLNGAGHIQAWDSRTQNSTAKGQLGGLLQATTYLAGLSGGSWLVGSLYTNNFTSIQDILAQDTSADKSGDLWQLEQTIFEGPKSGGIQLLSTADYFKDLLSIVGDKSDAGFDTSITDYWGRALSYQLVNASQGGPDYTFSSIADQDFFTSGSVPLPFLVADGRKPGEVIVPANTTIFSFDPWELGTYDASIYGFAPLKYVGTNFTDGKVASDQCVVGYDNVGFVMGTSSSLFNAILYSVNGTNTGDTSAFKAAITDTLQAVLEKLGDSNNDIASYPNPFFEYNSGTNHYAVSETLTLVDGGEDGQNVPLNPLIQPIREVDVIFAIDSSADTNTTYPTTESSANWPDGVSLLATYRRSLEPISNGTTFPSIPGQDTFMNLGLQSRPTFFGCDVKNLTGPSPLIVYLPNAPYVYNSNTSTYDLQYNDTERNAIILNAYNGATQGNATLDADWPACVGCAILSRSLHRTNTAVPEICTSCFDRYCWNGTIDESKPGNYVPALKLPADAVKVTDSGAVKLVTGVSMWAIVAALVVVMVA